MNITLLLIFIAASQQNHLPPGLLQSVCEIESNFNPKAISRRDGHGDSLGICQIKLKTAKWMGFKGTAKDLMNPENNIFYAAKYLAKNLKRYHGDTDKALVAYNQGSAKQLTQSKYSVKVLNKLRGRVLSCQNSKLGNRLPASATVKPLPLQTLTQKQMDSARLLITLVTLAFLLSFICMI